MSTSGTSGEVGVVQRLRWRALRSFSGRELLVAVAIAVTIRVVGLLVLDYGHPLSGDAVSYQTLATNLREFGTFSLDVDGPREPSVLRAPLYPALLALTQIGDGQRLFAIQALQLVLSLATTLMLALSVARWAPSAAKSVLFALALNPFDGAYCAAVLTETVTAFGIALTLAVLLLQRGRARFLAAGIVMGLVALTRDIAILLPLFFVGFLAVRAIPRRRSWRRTLTATGLIVLGTGLAIVPWTIRNAVQVHQLVPIARGGMGWNLWVGTWERGPEWMSGPALAYPDEAFDSETDRAFVATTFVESAEEAPPPGMTSVHSTEANARMTRMAVRRWREHPLDTLLTCVRRSRFTWLGTRSELFRYRVAALQTPGTLAWRVVKSAQWGINALVILAAACFLFWRLRSPRLRGLRFWLAIPIAMTALSYLPFHSTEVRYSQPILPLLFTAAAVGVTCALQWFAARRRTRPALQESIK